MRRIGITLMVVGLIGLMISFLASTAFASTRYTTVSGNSFTCSRTQPEYMLNAGGAVIQVQKNSYKFRVTRVDAPGYGGMSAPYITSGYNAYRNSSLCNTRSYHGAYRSRSYALPVLLGKQGNPVASVHDIVSSNFAGDSGMDIWLTATANKHSYAQMVNGGSGTTEIMIWLQSRHLPVAHSFRNRIDGRNWGITMGLARDGHGRNAHRAGWNVINFIAPRGYRANVTFSRLHLNAFIGYAIAHHWLSSSAYLMSVNQGFEISRGSASVAGYRLTGLPLH